MNYLLLVKLYNECSDISRVPLSDLPAYENALRREANALHTEFCFGHVDMYEVLSKLANVTEKQVTSLLKLINV